MRKAGLIVFVLLAVVTTRCKLGNSPHAEMILMVDVSAANNLSAKSNLFAEQLTNEQVIASLNSDSIIAAALAKTGNTDATSKIRASLQAEVLTYGTIHIKFYDGNKKFAIGFLNALFEECTDAYNQKKHNRAEDSLEIIEAKILLVEDKMDSLTDLAEKEGLNVNLEKLKEQFKEYYKKIAKGEKPEAIQKPDLKMGDEYATQGKQLMELKRKRNEFGIMKYYKSAPLRIVSAAHYVGGE